MLEVFGHALALAAAAGATSAAATPAMDRWKARWRDDDGRTFRRGACPSGRGRQG